MTPTDPQSLSRLRALLRDTALAPGQLVLQLAAERQKVARGTELEHEQIGIELRWLLRQPEAAEPEFANELGAARREWLALRVRGLAADPGRDAGVLFDLCDAQAEAAIQGDHELVGTCEAELARRITFAEADAALQEEANERVAALLASPEDVPLRHQVESLRRHSALFFALAAKTGSKRCARLARRLGRAGDDRELARRLESLLGRRGVVLVETTNFVLLLVVLVTLFVEMTMTLSERQVTIFNWIDASACTFFLVDFFFELSLHPRRISWFLRKVITDLLPAIPSVLFLVPGMAVPTGADELVVLRLGRLLRVTWAARYARLLLFLVRGMDGLVQRFSQLLNREFVFVPAAAEVRRRLIEDERRDLVFECLRHEHDLISILPKNDREAVLHARAKATRSMAGGLAPVRAGRWRDGAVERDVPLEQAIEQLWALRPQDIGRWLRPSDLRALDRMLRVLSVPPVRWLPIVRRFAVHPLPGSPEERIVALARRVAEWLQGWHGKLLFYADLHGIVTGPQILDRVAGAMVKATQRPAVRLLLFGGLFLLFDQLVHNEWLSHVLGKIVATPLIVLGSFCLVFLTLGRWLKSVAGEASESYRLTSEAHFLSQIERTKQHYEAVDLPFLTRRVLGHDRHTEVACRVLHTQLVSVRTGVPVTDRDVGGTLRFDCNRLALLYLHFLDGAPLHASDVKTTEQLLANQSIENLRTQFMRLTRRERKQLRRLKLDEGSLFSGPFLWFRFITESVAVEAAKRIDGYNRSCVPLAERAAATPAMLLCMQEWLQRRSDPKGGRTITEKRSEVKVDSCPTTEFTALDFVAADPERDRHIAAMFGDDVLDVVRMDRRTMVREIFGTRPVHHLPKHERSFNPLRFYHRRLSHGRVLFAPLLLGWRFVRSVRWLIVRIRQIVREVVDPDLAMQRREIGAAPFSVALRKIHRMKAPGLMEALRMRLQLDPGYAGAPVGWSRAEPVPESAEVERDLAFLHMHERECVPLRDRAAEVCRMVTELHAARAWLPEFDAPADPDLREAGELAVTSAWIADKDDVRTLLFAERWRAETLPGLLAEGVPGSWFGAVWRAVRSVFVVSTVDLWLQRHGRDLPAAARGVLHRAYARDLHGIRAVITAWSKLPAATSPAEVAIARLRDAYRNGPSIRRDLLALRAVQSLAVLDIRNYRDLVFRLGGYEEEGEDPQLGTALP
jgi:hypothetical protein